MVFLSEADFLIGKKVILPSFHDSLKERGTVQMLTVGREAALEVQVCVKRHFTYHILSCHISLFILNL